MPRQVNSTDPLEDVADPLSELAGSGASASTFSKISSGRFFSPSRSEKAVELLRGLPPGSKVPGMVGKTGTGVDVSSLLGKAKLGRIGTWGLRGAGVGAAALTTYELIKLLYDASYGWEKQGKLNRVTSSYSRMDQDQSAFDLADMGHESDLMSGAATASRALGTGAQGVALSEQAKLMEAVAPMQAQLAVNAYREKPSLAEMLAKMGYNAE